MSETVTLYKCNSCQKVILKPEDGLVIHGNIYVADPETRGGLVGDNFPTMSDTLGVKDCNIVDISDMVKETAFCIPCFLNACLPNAKLTTTR